MRVAFLLTDAVRSRIINEAIMEKDIKANLIYENNSWEYAFTDAAEYKKVNNKAVVA